MTVKITIDDGGRLITGSGEERIILCHDLVLEQFTLPANTKVVTVKAHNSHGMGGMLASCSNNVVTDGSWQCADLSRCNTKDCHVKWELAAAGRLERNFDRKIPGIKQSALWIWVQNQTAERVWCRKNFGK